MFSVLYLQTISWKKVACVAATLLLLFPSVTFGARLHFSPASGSYTVGSTLSVGVYASTDKALNAISGAISFPEDVLQVTSISKNQSIISLWVQEPSFSNTNGTVNFEGIVLNPGYTGESGKVLTINFRVKTAGTANLNFSSGSILANDGSGSEILSAKGSAQFTLIAEVPQEIVEDDTEVQQTDEGSGLTPAPKVATTILNPSGWANVTDGLFTFDISPDATALRLLLDDKPDSIPTVVYAPPITQKEIHDLPEGESYLHVQTRTDAGWGEVAHFKIAIDTRQPNELTVEQAITTVGSFDVQTLTIAGGDADSGVERIEVLLDGHEPKVFTNASYATYIVPELSLGAHVVRVRVYDNAGNYREEVLTLQGNKKEETPTVDGQGEKLSQFVASGMTLVTILSVVVPSAALILVLCLLLIFGWRQYKKYKNHVAEEVREVQQTVRSVFALMKSDLEADELLLLKAQKKRKLTKEEVKLLKHIRQNIEGAEKVIADEVRDIT